MREQHLAAYLVAEAKNWGFTADHYTAAAFLGYSRVLDGLGTGTRVSAARAKEIYETCDCCKRQDLAIDLFFDGKRFLCHNCRS